MFAHLAAAWQCLPAMANMLVDMGWDKTDINSAVDTSGAMVCLELLAHDGIYILADGTIKTGSKPDGCVSGHALLWGQARKMHTILSDVLQAKNETIMRDMLAGDLRQLSRLNSSSGPCAGKWLDSFPSSWWPEFPDDSFLFALRFRTGVPVVGVGNTCHHCRLKDRKSERAECGKHLDIWGDHAVICAIGGHLFTRSRSTRGVCCFVRTNCARTYEN